MYVPKQLYDIILPINHNPSPPFDSWYTTLIDRNDYYTRCSKNREFRKFKLNHINYISPTA